MRRQQKVGDPQTLNTAVWPHLCPATLSSPSVRSGSPPSIYLPVIPFPSLPPLLPYINPTIFPMSPPTDSVSAIPLCKTLAFPKRNRRASPNSPLYIFIIFRETAKQKEMEAMKMKLFLAVVMMILAVSAVQPAAAATAPAPAPASDAAIFVPTFFASLTALAFGFLLWETHSSSWLLISFSLPTPPFLPLVSRGREGRGGGEVKWV